MSARALAADRIGVAAPAPQRALHADERQDERLVRDSLEQRSDEVYDLRELQRRSALFFAPLRYAGGSKVKILEAMAAGLPVITTSKGVSGLAVNNGEHYLGSDDSGQLALDHSLGLTSLTLAQRLAYADDGRDTRRQCTLRLLGHIGV